jgi:Fur family ferric uptake transcriptional regulator
VDAPRTAGLTDVARRLREAGLRATAPRLAVLGELVVSPGHHGADELADRLEARGVRIARASVFNVLDDLVRCELVMIADAGPGRALYEVRETEHHHFVCRRCGVVADVACVVGERPCLDAAIPGALVDQAQVIFRGLCAGCRAA